MKKLFAILVPIAIGMLLTASMSAQAPEKMTYQAVLRDNANKLITDHSVGIQISILNNTEEGTPVYVERHFPQTNSNGLVTLEIGIGTIVSGNFSTINWAEGSYFLKTETDPNGGSNYTISQTTQLLSVPYALHANAASSLTGELPETDPIFESSEASSITSTHLTNWNSAFGWGNHALAGYLTSFSETDPLWSVSPSFGITNTNISNWNSAFGWGNHASEGYLKSFSESDPTWNGSATSTDRISRSGNVGIGVDKPLTALHINSTRGFLIESATSGWAGGSLGEGKRLMWIPGRSAFRVGYSSATGWDQDSIGNYSMAWGYGTVASGDNSTAGGKDSKATGSSSLALGSENKASGMVSVSLGRLTEAIGMYSIAMGYNTIAEGSYSFALGSSNKAEGQAAVAIGQNNIAQARNMVVFGRYNLYSGTPKSWVSTDPLFVIGNGTSSERSNALTILKDGRMGIGTHQPTQMLDIEGRVRIRGGNPGNRKVLVSDADGNATWEKKMYQIGEYAHGGVVFWLDETGMHGLVCAIEDAASNMGWQSLDADSKFTGARANGIYGGRINTAIIRAAYMGMGYYYQNAASKALTYMGNNYGDWFLPSKYELNLMYQQRYTINVTAILSGGEAFSNENYWSSTESGHYTYKAWAQNFYGGAQDRKSKNSDYRVRAIRAF